MKLNKLYALILIFLVTGITFSLYAQTKKIPDDFEKLIEKAKMANANKNYTEAVRLYTKADAIAKKSDYYQYHWFIKNNLGNIYKDLSNYGEALGYYNEGLSLIEKHKELEEKRIVFLNNIGLLYVRINENDKALEYYNKAYKSIGENASSYDKYAKIVLAVNIADIYNKQNKLDKAYQILQEVRDKINEPYVKERGKQTWEINYAENLFLKGEIEKAQALVEKLLAETHPNDVGKCYVCVLELLSRIYAKEGNIEKAIAYTQKGLDENKELKDRIDLYEKMAGFYQRKKKYILAFNYKDSVIQTKDSLAKRINNQLFETNKVKLDIQEYQNELKLSKQKQKGERIIFILIGVFALIVFYAVYRGLKNRIIKQRQEKELAENKQKIIKLELKEMKNDVAEKNRELSAKALYLSGRNKLIEEVISALSKLPEVSNSKEINQYIKNLKGYLKTDTEWEEFIAHFEQVNPTFIKTLKQRHPKLTSNDIRFLCYMFMNLDIKEISTIFSITAEATRKRKQRISKKMEVDVENLHSYILTLT